MKQAEKREFDAKVIGKWIKGMFWKRPMISLELQGELRPKYIDVGVRTAVWNAVEIGQRVGVPMYRDVF